MRRVLFKRVLSIIEGMIPYLTMSLSFALLLIIFLGSDGDLATRIALAAALMNVIASALAALASHRVVALGLSSMVPKIRAGLDPHRVPGLWTFFIENVGKSAAYDVQIDISGAPFIKDKLQERSFPTLIKSMLPSEPPLVFSISPLADPKVLDLAQPVEIRIKYKDADGESYEEVVRQDIEKWKGTLRDFSLEQRFYSLAQHIENDLRHLERSVRELAKKL